MIEGTGVHMANHSTGWFALINIINLPILSDGDFELIYSNNRYAITNFQQLLMLRSKFVPIVGYNSKIAVRKIFKE